MSTVNNYDISFIRKQVCKKWNVFTRSGLLVINISATFQLKKGKIFTSFVLPKYVNNKKDDDKDKHTNGSSQTSQDSVSTRAFAFCEEEIQKLLFQT